MKRSDVKNQERANRRANVIVHEPIPAFETGEPGVIRVEMTRTTLYNALATLLYTEATGDWIKENDPKAYTQARSALAMFETGKELRDV